MRSCGATPSFPATVARLQYEYNGAGDGIPSLDIEIWANSKTDATYLVCIKSALTGTDMGNITVNRATGYVAGIHVRPAFRRIGLGMMLLILAQRMSLYPLHIDEPHMNTKEGNGLWQKWLRVRSRS